MNAHSPAIASLPETRRPRKRITHWGKGAFAGLIGGALFITVEMFLMQVFGKGSLWDPVRLSASIALGNRAVATSTPFTSDILFVGMFMHFILSILYAVVLGLLIRKLKPPAAVLVGAAFGLALYLFHFYGLAAFYPWVAGWRNWIVIVSHLVFGMSTAWIFSHLHRRQLLQEAVALSKNG